jgi:hypothetical protein
MEQGDPGTHPQETRKGSFWVRNGMLLMVLFVAGLGLYQLRDYWYPIYQYRLGTPTTATIDHCDMSSGKRYLTTCTGTWTVNGQSQSGVIDGADRILPAGSSLAVHVNDGNAYTARSVHMSIFMLVFFGLLLIGLCTLMIRGVRRMRTGR